MIDYDGASWGLAESGLPPVRREADLYAVWGSGPDDVWIGGNGVLAPLEAEPEAAMSRRARIMLWMLGVPAAVSGVAAGGANAEEQWHETTPTLEDGSVVPTVPDDAAVVPEDPNGDAPDVLEPTRACSYDHWCPTPLPKSAVSPKKYDLRAVWVAPNHEAFAASYGGDVLAWDGVAWKEILCLTGPGSCGFGCQRGRALARHRGAAPLPWNEERRKRVVVRRGPHAPWWGARGVGRERE